MRSLLRLSGLRRTSTRLLIAGVFVLLGATSSGAQGAAVARPDESVYEGLDLLIAAGLIDSAIVAQRPYSWRQIGRMLDEAAVRARSLDGVAGYRAHTLANVLARLRSRVATGLPGASRIDFLTRTAMTDASPRAILANGVGEVEADVSPLTDRRLGRRSRPGGEASVEVDVALEPVAGLAFQLQPRLTGWTGHGQIGAKASAELLAGSARIVMSNVAVSVGRQYTIWSPSADGGLFFSDNGPALDLVRIASDRPFHLPSLLHYLGQVGATVQVADVGPSVHNSHSRLVSYKVSVAPSPGVEFGGTFANHFGGAGAKNPSTLIRIVDLLPFVDVFRAHHDSSDFDSDKLLGVDGRVRISALGGLTAFGELAIEDFDIHRMKSVLTEDAGYSFGMAFPTLLTPALSARLRYHTLGIRFYEHHAVRNGFAARRFLLGDPLGRDGSGFDGTILWSGAKGVCVSAGATYEVRRDDQYDGRYVNGDSTGLVFTRTAVGERERRARGILGARWFAPGELMEMSISAGLERTSTELVRQSSLHGIVSASITLRR